MKLTHQYQYNKDAECHASSSSLKESEKTYIQVPKALKKYVSSNELKLYTHTLYDYQSN
jgi:hypothetical protein